MKTYIWLFIILTLAQMVFALAWFLFIKKLDRVSIVGLMGMATFTSDEDQVRKEFKGLKTLFEKLKTGPLPANVAMTELSMGMSGDYQIAIEEGSTMIRVGSAIFGERA